MKRTYLILLIVVACAAALGMFIAEHTGYVLISWKSFRYESSLWVFLAVLTVIIAMLYGLRTLIKMTLISSGLINPWSRRNQGRRLRQAAEQGILDLAQGHWKKRFTPFAPCRAGRSETFGVFAWRSLGCRKAWLQRRS